MKIPRISRNNVVRAVKTTVKTSKSVINHAHLSELKNNGRKLMAAFMFVSSGLNPQTAKVMAVSNRMTSHGGDVFEHSVNSYLIKDCFNARPHTIKRNLAKSPLLQSAKNIPLMADSNKSVKEFNKLLNNLLLKKKNINNPLVNKADVFISKGKEYGVNPAVLMAIAMTESARGTSKAALSKNNVGGIMGKRSLRTFAKVDDCIEVMAQTISNHHNKSKLQSVADLGYSGKYCDKSVAEEWIKNVMFYIKKLS